VGFVPEYAPDPAEATFAKVRQLGIEVAGFVPQPHLQDVGVLGLSTAKSVRAGKEVTESATVSRSYTLWRNPADHADPVNWVELHEATQRALDSDPGPARPPWMLRAIERMRHPFLVDVVHTNWTAPGREPVGSIDDLVQHMNYILNNLYRDDYHGQHEDFTQWVHVIATHDVQDGYAVTVDGKQRAGVIVDTNPHILGLGVQLDNRTMTAVVPREYITMIDLDFASKLPL
jgi:hypothetical protein